ncbi:PACE efflux transporter [Parathalassolituus penaei]|uniref:PACE efflux transporter n=1 Tax=Parathalassolituus penaei TaxID=2997323 RepID=A0A9X3EDR1_9GAMM|nr:PACE efflux transporter [Parathalassolituus penaei]MCY0965697.1 PACE efflux transporter [Parathalassolituus penaei]
MNSRLRLLLYVSLYELIAWFLTSAVCLYMGKNPQESGAAAALVTLLAVSWNWGWNLIFEAWERRYPQTHRGQRSFWRRCGHAIGFEGGLVLILVPAMAWWFGISLWQAFLLEGGLLLFFLLYSWVFSWSFDQIFGPPASVTR